MTEPAWLDCADYFGEAFAGVKAFGELLERFGPERGLIGPREVPRLWSRHLLNSAAVVQFVPETGSVIDLGSGAGLPGVVIGLMPPGLAVELVEPMERRTSWLSQVTAELGLSNVTVTRARAQELAGRRTASVVTARAVAPLEKLVSWAVPLLGAGGQLLAIKGERAEAELEQARTAVLRAGLVQPTVLAAPTVPGTPVTYVVRARRL